MPSGKAGSGFVPINELGEESRGDQIVSIIRESDKPMTIREVADDLGISYNAVNTHVKRLSAEGKLLGQHRGGSGRPPVEFIVAE